MNEEKIWFNQQLIYQKDKTYTGNGVLEISINNNTSNYQTFSASALNLSVSNDQIRKTQSLNYQNITDLVYSLEEVIRTQHSIYSNGGCEIIKKYSQDKTLKLKFQTSKSGEKICILTIMNNESDLSRVVINLDIVLTITELFKSFIRDYINVNSNFINRCISIETLNQIKNMRDSIKTLPSFFGTLNSSNTNVIEVKDDQMEDVDIKAVEENINDLDKFLGENMENIKIPEIDSPKKTNEEKNPIIVNDFVSNFLKNDLSVLENVLMSSVLNENPFKSIVDNIQNTLQINDSLIPDISDNDLKSISYISKKFYLEILKKYTDFNEKIPSSITVLKYNILDQTKIKEINKALSLDLLLILSYLKNLKDKLESREPDAVKNKSLLYLNFRLFLDPLLFTFIESINPTIIKPLMKDKFNTYSKIGLFKTYSNILSSYNLDDITENQIVEFVDLLQNKIINNSENVDESHKMLYNNEILKLQNENDLTLEQIINEYVPMELHLNFNKDCCTKEDIKFKFPNTDEKIINYLFKEEKLLVKDDKEIIKHERKSNIERMCQFLNNEIPEKYKIEFATYIKSLKKDNFSPEQVTFDLLEIGDSVLKTIYVWNNSDKSESYADFSTKIETCILDKNTIISSLTKKVVEEDVIEDWIKLDLN